MNQQWQQPQQNPNAGWQPSPQQQPWQMPPPQVRQMPPQQPPQRPPQPPQGVPPKLPKAKGNPTKKKKIALYLLYGSAILTGIGFLVTLAIYLMRY